MPNLATLLYPDAISRVPLTVRFVETDLMGIVHHANYLIYFEQARVEYFLRRGAVFEEWAQRGIHFPVVESHVRYRKPAFFNQQLMIDCWLHEVSRASARFDYAIYADQQQLTEGYTVIACVNSQRKLQRVPDDILALMKASESYISQ